MVSVIPSFAKYICSFEIIYLIVSDDEDFMGFCIQVNGSASEDKASEALRCEICNQGLTISFIVDT